MSVLAKKLVGERKGIVIIGTYQVVVGGSAGGVKEAHNTDSQGPTLPTSDLQPEQPHLLAGALP